VTRCRVVRLIARVVRIRRWPLTAVDSTHALLLAFEDEIERIHGAELRRRDRQSEADYGTIPF
jgi:hypothetical protein